jgi:hypothetical protein
MDKTTVLPTSPPDQRFPNVISYKTVSVSVALLQEGLPTLQAGSRTPAGGATVAVLVVVWADAHGATSASKPASAHDETRRDHIMDFELGDTQSDPPELGVQSAARLHAPPSVAREK